ncbi:MAG TPA: hypothetical protein VGA18_00840 [Rhodothermales bacterium]
MRPAVVALLLGGVVLSGCESKGSAGPGIPDSLLVDVLVDVYSATARAHLDGTDPDSARVEAMAHFGLDTVALNRTLHYFAENPDSAATVYQRALDSLIVFQRNLRSAPELDSLARHIRG